MGCFEVIKVSKIKKPPQSGSFLVKPEWPPLFPGLLQKFRPVLVQ